MEEGNYLEEQAVRCESNSEREKQRERVLLLSVKFNMPVAI